MLSKAIRHIERAIRGETVESEDEEAKKGKKETNSRSGTPSRSQTPPKSTTPKKPKVPKVAKGKVLKRSNSNVSSTSNAQSNASNEDDRFSESEKNSELSEPDIGSGKITPNEHRPVKKRKIPDNAGKVSRLSASSAATPRVRPISVTEVKPADSSTSLTQLIDGVPATEAKIGFIGCGIMGTSQ